MAVGDRPASAHAPSPTAHRRHDFLTGIGYHAAVQTEFRKSSLLAVSLAFAAGAALVSTGESVSATPTGVTAKASASPSHLEPGQTAELRAKALVEGSGLHDTTITQHIDPRKVHLTGPGDITAPDGFTLTYSSDGSNYSATAPASSAEWAAVKAVRATGPVQSDGTSGNRQLLLGKADAVLPASSSITGGTSGDGFTVIFDDRDAVLNIFHHNGPDERSPAVDCHWRDGSRCGAKWPFSLTGLKTFQRSPGWIDQANHHLWFNTRSATGKGFGCVDLADLASPTFCGGGSAKFTELSPGGGEAAEIVAADGKIFSTDASNGKLMCLDPSANAAAGAACPGQPYTLPGISYYDPWGSREDSFEGKVIVTVDPKATCFDPSTLAICSGSWPISVLAASRVLAPVPSASGSLRGVCFLTYWSLVHKCTDLSGSDISISAALRSTLSDIGNFYEGGVVHRNYYAADPIMVGSRIYAASGNFSSSRAPIVCFDAAEDQVCPNWPTRAKTYSIQVDPQNDNCLWTNGDDGAIRAWDALSGEEACSSAPSVNSFATTSLFPARTCGGGVKGWRSFTITSKQLNGYEYANIDVLDSNGNPVPGWEHVPLDPNANGQPSTSLQDLEASLTGATPTFRLRLAGFNSPDPVKISIVQEADPVALCTTVTANARCSGTGPGLVPAVPGWAINLNAEVTAKRSGEQQVEDRDAQGLSMDGVAPETCGATLTGTAAVGGEGLGGVEVELLDSSGNPVLEQGTPVRASTGKDGSYTFGPLLPGGYAVRFVDHARFKVADSTVNAGGSGTTTASSGEVLSNTATLATGDLGVINARFVAGPRTPDRSKEITASQVAHLDPYQGAKPAEASTGSSFDQTSSTKLCDPASSPLDCSLTTLPVAGEGTWVVDATDGSVRFTPEAGFSGPATSIPYRATDQASKVAKGTLDVLVVPPPTVSPATSRGAAGQPQLLAPLAAWTPARYGKLLDLSTLRLCAAGETPPSCTARSVVVRGEGTFAVQQDGSVTFTPEVSFSGDATPIAYQVADTLGQVADATLHPSVDPVAAPTTTTTTPGVGGSSSQGGLASTGGNLAALLSVALLLLAAGMVLFGRGERRRVR